MFFSVALAQNKYISIPTESEFFLSGLSVHPSISNEMKKFKKKKIGISLLNKFIHLKQAQFSCISNCLLLI